MRAPRPTDAKQHHLLDGIRKTCLEQASWPFTLLDPDQLRLGSCFAIPPVSDFCWPAVPCPRPMPYSYFSGTVLLHELICIGWTWEHLVKQVMQGKAHCTANHASPNIPWNPYE